MLTNLDKELIEQEAHRFDIEIKPLIDCNIVKSLDDLLKNYNLHEFTVHWYKSSPRNNSCALCESEIPCSKCEIWKEWNFSKEQLSFNNWTDVEGPGTEMMSQEECNKRAKDRLEIIHKDKDFSIRTFYYYYKNYFNIFYYNRDREQFDYWFVFEKKAGAGSSSKKN